MTGSRTQYVAHDNVTDAHEKRIKDALGDYHDLIGAPPFQKSAGLHQYKDGDTIVCEAVCESVYKLFHIELLVTYPAYRGQGFGAAFLKELEAHAREKGMVTMSLSTASYQAPGFYTKCGFTEVARFPLGITHNGKPQDKIYFRKILD
ncbi:MAG: N-acetyltransferase family protein [Pseudobdellovibrionaceae bacterium]